MKINLKRLYTISLLTISTINLLRKHNSHNKSIIKRQFISILYNLFDGKSIKLRHNEALTLNCQLMLKKNNTHICDELFFHFYIRA